MLLYARLDSGESATATPLSRSTLSATASVRLDVGTDEGTGAPSRTYDEELPLDTDDCMEHSPPEDAQADANNIDSTYPYSNGLATEHITYSYPLLGESSHASHEWLTDDEGNQYIYDNAEEDIHSNKDDSRNNQHRSFRSQPPPSSQRPVLVTQAKKVGGFVLGPIGGYTFEWVINRLYRTPKLQGICPPDRKPPPFTSQRAL